MKNPVFTGAGVAIITPMYEDGSINFDELGRIIEDQIAHHTDAIIICGTTGECSTMTDEEQLAAIKYTVDVVNHRVPVIAGAGSNDTDHGCALAAKSAACGADALLMVTPYYNKTSQAGLVAHFTAMAEAGGIPVIVYNVPSRTGLNIAPETAKELSKHPLINGIKEASGNIGQVAKIAALCGDELNIYSGNDDQVVPLLSLGVPGDSVTAILLGAFIMKGITPGPMMYVTELPTVYRVFAALMLANLCMLVVGCLGVRFFAKIVSVEKKMLYPIILVISLLGAFSINKNAFDVGVCVAFGIIGNLAGYPIFDPIAALIVGFMISRMGWEFAWDALHDLMDRSADDEEVQRIRQTILETPGVLGAHDLRTRKMGDMIIVDAHIEVDATQTVEAGHDIAVNVRQRVLKKHRVLNLMAHVDPSQRPDRDHPQGFVADAS